MPCRARVSPSGSQPAFGRREAGERVEHGIEVGREREAEVLVVVAGVDDHREVLAAQAIQPVGELRAADLSAECNHRSHSAMLA